MEQNMQANGQKGRSIKKSFVTTLVVLLVAIVSFSAQTYAYFVDSTTSEDNRIASGTLGVELIQVQESGEQVEHPIAPVRILPGTSIKREVSVRNTGTLPVYLRIKIEKSILESENEIPSGWEDLITCNFKVDDESTPEVSEGLWVYRDGYYYYMIDVVSGAITAPLFDTVSISAVMGNEFENSKIGIRVICQAVQSGSNSDSPLTAWGWPDASTLEGGSR